MQFPNPIVKYLIIVDNNGFPVVTIGPGPVIQVTNPIGSRIEINDAGIGGTAPTIFFYNDDRSNFAYINLGVHAPPNAELGINSGSYVNAAGHTVRPRLYFPNSAGLSIVNNAQTPEGGSLAVTDTYATMNFNEPSNSVASAFVEAFTQTTQMVTTDIATGNTVLSRIFVANNDILMQSGDGTGLNGPIVGLDSTTVQFKNTLAQVNPVQYQKSSKWMGVSGADWTNLILQNGWVGLPGYSTPQCKLEVDGRCVLRGNIQSGNSADGIVAMLLPANTALFPPSQCKVKPTIEGGGTAFARLNIDTLGNIVLFGCSGATQIGFDGLSFSVTHL
jgi:hypothetical protein